MNIQYGSTDENRIFDSQRLHFNKNHHLILYFMTVEQQLSIEEEISQLETDLFLLKEQKNPDNREIHRIEKRLEDLNERLTSG